MSTGAEALRALLQSGEVLHAPGCFDAVSAKLAEAAGFRAAYCSGAAAAAVALGEPDLGFAGLTELSAQVSAVASATSLPVITDADTGFGNPLHAARAATVLAAAGAAAVQIEDQVFPKRCGHMAGKALIDVNEMAAKVRAVADTGACVVIARTDAHSVLGPAAAVERAVAYAEAGADVLFVEGTADPQLLGEVAAGTGLPLMVNASEAAGPIDIPTDDVLAAAGVRVVIHPVTLLLAAAGAMRAALRRLAGTSAAGTLAPDVTSTPLTWDELTNLLGLDGALAAEARYATPLEVL